MKRSGILNPALAGAIARLGHTDTVVIADCGLPIPDGVTVVDLALVFGIPRFQQVLDAVLDDVVVERATVALEAQNTVVTEWVGARVDMTDAIPHEDLKRVVKDASLVIRTGEATSYANVILHCGVPF